MATLGEARVSLRSRQPNIVVVMADDLDIELGQCNCLNRSLKRLTNLSSNENARRVIMYLKKKKCYLYFLVIFFPLFSTGDKNSGKISTIPGETVEVAGCAQGR